MSDLKTRLAAGLTDKLREQSFIVLLLLIWGYWITQKNDTCNERQIQQYEKQMELLQTIIKDNTKALDQNSQALQMIQNK